MKKILHITTTLSLLFVSAFALPGCSSQKAESPAAASAEKMPETQAATTAPSQQTIDETSAKETSAAEPSAEEASPPASDTTESEPVTSETTAGSQAFTSSEPIKLEPDTEYYYDLDFDGTAEKISYTIRPIDEWDSSPTLFINDQEQIYSTNYQTYGYGGGLYLLDIDTSDQLLDLHFEWLSDSNTLSLFNFLQYKDGTLINAGDLNGIPIVGGQGSLYRTSSGITTRGNGTFQLKADTPVYNPSIGCYLCTMTFQLKDSTVTVVPQTEYEISVFDRQQTYQAKTGFTTTISPGTNEPAFAVSAGESVAIDKICFIGDDFYARVVNASGQKGWFLTGEEVFHETPAWG